VYQSDDERSVPKADQPKKTNGPKMKNINKNYASNGLKQSKLAFGNNKNCNYS